MWEKIYYSFPVQLLALHLRKNLLLLSLWLLLSLIVLQKFGAVLGIPFLFLDPEYLNTVSWQGFFLISISLAVFTMAFHMTTYILVGAQFKFLAVVPKPFIHYCLNNSLLPLFFYILYISSFVGFQLDNEHENTWIVLHFLLGFGGGTFITYLILFGYFGFTNKDFFILFADSLEKKLKQTSIPRANILKQIREGKKNQDKVLEYLHINFRFQKVRQDLSRFQGQQLMRVFDQNHLNLLIIQAVLVGLILVLGFFRENPLLQIPAAASALLLFAIITMVIGALAFWFREWSATLVFGGLIGFNMISSSDLLNRPHAAFGLDYQVEPAPYNLGEMQKNLHPDSVQKDMEVTIGILNNWRKKFPEDQKPRLVMVATSGGGQRAALWTLRVLQEAEKYSGQQLFKHTHMITGASGGLIGAAFFRELYLQAASGEVEDVFSPDYLDQISADNLNPIIFTMLVNDMLIRNQYFEYNQHRYLKDRGYAFENQLNYNTQGILDKPLEAYIIPEQQSLVPMLPIAPLITNDGRKLYISPHSMAYMCISQNRSEGFHEKSQGVDFLRFFREQDSGKLRFISALRMGASFPFVTPNIQLPSQPRMVTMDSGLADNFGIQDALRFMHVFQDWIAVNTSGVTLLTIRDSEKFTEIEQKKPPRFLEKLFTPLKNIYINWDNVQTLNNEMHFNRMKETLPFELDRIEFEYSTAQYLRERGSAEPKGNVNVQEQELQRASLNWRLTAREKKSIVNNIRNSQNSSALIKISEIDFLKDLK
jgi:hypothetical protein